MPSILFWTKIFLVAAACSNLFGCGKANDMAPALGSTNAHPDGWLTKHRVEYSKNPHSCRECHGTDLKGGITKVDCFNQSAAGRCHANGHGPRIAPHVLPFTDGAVHGPVAKKDLVYCQSCHGTAGGAGSNPRFNVAYGSIPAGCETSGCHNAQMAHPKKPWQAHTSSGNQQNACALCHGASFGGGNGRSCISCHSGLLAGIIPVAGQCLSCHGTPPNGTVTPNRAGSHAAHLALPLMSGNCAACHTGGGSGAISHSTTITMAFPVALGSTATFNGTTCSNITCHGGQVSPAWGTTLDVIANCTTCHQPAAAYPGYHSGQHNEHLAQGILCTDCHDMTDQAAHFGNVTTPVFDTLPATTLRSYLNYNQTAQSCMVSTPPPPGVQFTGCHSNNRSWP